MIKLEIEFVCGSDGFSSDPLTYKQIIRNENFAMYERSRDGKVHEYEVFKITFTKKGTKLFNTVIEDDTERYPSAEKFGRTAWSIKSYDKAMQKFNDLTNKYNNMNNETQNTDNTNDVTTTPTTPKRGRRAAAHNIIYPSNQKQFTMADLRKSNPGLSQPVLYIHIQKDIQANKVKKIGVVETSARGKKPVIYALV